jgi:hypothetical protein
MSDLENLLGYVGAREGGDAPVPVEVAPDILTMPFWTPEFCALVVRAAEATGTFAPDADDPVPGHEVSLAAIAPALYAHLENDIGRRMWPAIRGWWPLVDYHGLRDAFVIKYEKGGQEELRMHHDVAQVSASIKLNDGYEGGALAFARQKWNTSGLPVGALVAWPSLVTHPHAGEPLVSGTKYSLTIWCELPLAYD